MEDPRTVITRWIDDRRQERDAPALAWLVERAAVALVACYPAGQGGDVLWALARKVAGPEQEG